MLLVFASSPFDWQRLALQLMILSFSISFDSFACQFILFHISSMVDSLFLIFVALWSTLSKYCRPPMIFITFYVCFDHLSINQMPFHLLYICVSTFLNVIMITVDSISCWIIRPCSNYYFQWQINCRHSFNQIMTHFSQSFFLSCGCYLRFFEIEIQFCFCLTIILVPTKKNHSQLKKISIIQIFTNTHTQEQQRRTTRTIACWINSCALSFLDAFHFCIMLRGHRCQRCHHVSFSLAVLSAYAFYLNYTCGAQF